MVKVGFAQGSIDGFQLFLRSRVPQQIYRMDQLLYQLSGFLLMAVHEWLGERPQGRVPMAGEVGCPCSEWPAGGFLREKPLPPRKPNAILERKAEENGVGFLTLKLSKTFEPMI
jgi:hypothetical protein